MFNHAKIAYFQPITVAGNQPADEIVKLIVPKNTFNLNSPGVAKPQKAQLPPQIPHDENTKFVKHSIDDIGFNWDNLKNIFDALKKAGFKIFYAVKGNYLPMNSFKEFKKNILLEAYHVEAQIQRLQKISSKFKT